MAWMQAVCKTGVFIICAQVLVHFRPDKSYEKYLKMLVSAMILMQLFLPVSNFFTGTGERSLAARMAWFQTQLQDSMDQAASVYEERERQMEQIALQELTENLERTDLIETEDMLPQEMDAGQSEDTDPVRQEQMKDRKQADVSDQIKIDPINEIDDINKIDKIKIQPNAEAYAEQEEEADGTDRTHRTNE